MLPTAFPGSEYRFPLPDPFDPRSTVSAAEFMRRYLQHVPPPGQHRVRYFGWMHPSAKARWMKVDGARR